MARNSESKSPGIDILKLCYLAYFSVITIYTVAYLFPEGRIWGVNIWAYLPETFLYSLIGISIIIFLIIWQLNKENVIESNGGDSAEIKNSTTLFVMIAISAILIIFFYFLKAKTFFLGDGYTLLSLLGKESPLIEKQRQLGESLLHVWVYNLIGGKGEQNALVAFQIISISAGALFLSLLGFFSTKIFSNNRDRMLFFIGIASGGYMLMFFGYVENYSIFANSILIYSLSSILIVQGKLKSWAIIPLQALAIFFHIFGVTLIPATIYILLSKTKLGKSLGDIKVRTKIIGIASLGILIVWGFAHFYINDYFFRLSLVPIYGDILTIEGYTLFSIPHLVDLVNLIVLLIPGITVIILCIMFLPIKKIIRTSEFKVLGLIVVGAIGAVFIFDPKLGMPRDWDLFAFSGVALSLFLYYILVSNSDKIKNLGTIVALASMLGFLSLIPRAFSLTNDDASVLHFKNYLKLDNIKNRNSRLILVNYYKNKGNKKLEDETRDQWKLDFPEEVLIMKANQLYAQRKYSETISMLYRILNMNPVYSDAYGFLGSCYTDLQKPDSAIENLRIAIALSPYRLNFISTLGLAYIYKGDYDLAEKTLYDAISLDSTQFAPYYNLANMYKLQKNREKYFENLTHAATKKDSPIQIVKELIQYCLSTNNFGLANKLIDRNEIIKKDTLYIRQLRENYPDLNR